MYTYVYTCIHIISAGTKGWSCPVEESNCSVWGQKSSLPCCVCNRVYCIHVPGHDPLIFSFLSLILFDWVGILWPQLSKVLKLVRWARRVHSSGAVWESRRTSRAVRPNEPSVSVDVKFIEPCFGIGHNLSLICNLTSEDIKQHFTTTAASPFPPVSLQRQVVCLLLRPVIMCSSQGRAYTVSWLVQIKSYSNLWCVTLHPCFQPASLTPLPTPLPYMCVFTDSLYFQFHNYVVVVVIFVVFFVVLIVVFCCCFLFFVFFVFFCFVFHFRVCSHSLYFSIPCTFSRSVLLSYIFLCQCSTLVDWV